MEDRSGTGCCGAGIVLPRVLVLGSAPPHSPERGAPGKSLALGSVQGSGSCGQHGLARLSASWPALQLLTFKGTAPK